MLRKKNIGLYLMLFILIFVCVGCNKKLNKTEYINKQIELTQEIQPIARNISSIYSEYFTNRIDSETFLNKINDCKKQYIDYNKNFEKIKLDKNENLNKNEEKALEKLSNSRKNLYVILENTIDEKGNLKNKKTIFNIYEKQMILIQNNLKEFKMLYK